jgi:hypothetical protein
LILGENIPRDQIDKDSNGGEYDDEYDDMDYDDEEDKKESKPMKDEGFGGIEDQFGNDFNDDDDEPENDDEKLLMKPYLEKYQLPSPL